MTDKEKDNNIKDVNLGQGIDSSFLRFVNLKSKKLVQATYLVTSLISDSEPLKWRFRDFVLELLSDTSLLVPASGLSNGTSEASQISPLFKISVLESVLNRLDQIINLLDIFLSANFVSEMNFSILKNEFEKLQKGIISRLGKGLKEIVGPQEANQFLLLNQAEDLLDTERPFIGHSLAGSLSRREGHLSERFQDKISELAKDNLREKKDSNVKSKMSNKDSRRNEIVAFLKGKSWTSIKDISEAISGCSTKTIQRELSDLVQSGVLKKKGDRRWSRYLLA